MAINRVSTWRRLLTGLAATLAMLFLLPEKAPAFSLMDDFEGVPVPLSDLRPLRPTVGIGTPDNPVVGDPAPYRESIFSIPATAVLLDGGAIRDLDLYIRLRHPRPETLQIFLRHTIFNNPLDVAAIHVMSLGTGCSTLDFNSQELFNQDIALYIDDQALADIDGACARDIPSLRDRYFPTSVKLFPNGNFLSTFNGRAIDGQFDLIIRDWGTLFDLPGAAGSLVEWGVIINGAQEGDVAPREGTPSTPRRQSGNSIITEQDYVTNAFHLLDLLTIDQRVVAGGWRGFGSPLSSALPDTLTDLVKDPFDPFAYQAIRRSSGTEFTRLDSAPASTAGDGVLSVADFVQSARYAASLDAVIDGNGPLSRNDRIITAKVFQPDPANPGQFILSPGLFRGDTQPTRVSVTMRSTNSETEVAFGLRWDPTLVELLSVERGPCIPGDAIFQVDRNTDVEPGLVGLRVGVKPDQSFLCLPEPESPLKTTGAGGEIRDIVNVLADSTATAPLFTTNRITTSYDIDFTTNPFNPMVMLHVDVSDNRTVVRDFSFDLLVDKTKLVRPVDPADLFPDFGGTVTVTQIGYDPHDPIEVEPDNPYFDFTIYRVQGINPASTFVNGRLISLQFQVEAARSTRFGGFSPNIPSIRLLPSPQQQLGFGPFRSGSPNFDRSLNFPQATTLGGNPIFNFLSAGSVTADRTSDEVLFTTRIDDSRTGSRFTAGPLANRPGLEENILFERADNRLGADLLFDVLAESATITNPDGSTTEVQGRRVFVRVAENVQAVNSYSIVIQYDRTAANLSQIGKGEFSAENPVIGEDLNIGNLRRVSIKATVNNDRSFGFMNGVLADFFFVPVGPRDLDTVEVTFSEGNDFLRSAALIARTELAGNLQLLEIKSRFTTRTFNLATGTNKALDPAGAQPAATDIAATDDKAIDPRPNQGAVATEFVDYERNANDELLVRVGVNAQTFAVGTVPAPAVTGYRFFLNYDAEVLELLPSTARASGIGGFDTLPTFSPAPEVVYTGTPVSRLSVPNQPSNNFVSVLVQASDADSTLRNGRLFDVQFRVRGRIFVPPSVTITSVPIVNETIELAYFNFRAVEGTGAGVSPINFVNEPFADGRFVRNPGGTTIPAYFVDSSLTVIDTATPIPTVRVRDAVLQSGQEATVQIVLDSVGLENATGFTLNFDRSRLTLLGVSPGRDFPAAGFFYTNPEQNRLADANATGQLKLLAALPPGNTFAAGTRFLVDLRFRAIDTPDTLEAAFTFGKLGDTLEIVDEAARVLVSRFPAGKVSIAGSNCVYTAAPATATVSPEGGNGSFTLQTDSTCVWVASTPTPWITITSAPSGIGVDTVRYTVAPYNGSTPRVGVIEVAGALHTVTQQPCSFTLSVSELLFTEFGGETTFAVQTQSPCSWRAETAAPWITFVGNPFGTGNGTVRFRVAENVGLPRTATINVNGATLTVVQDTCSFTLSASATSFPETGGAGTVTVGTASSCTWRAESLNNWIVLQENPFGTGSGTISFTIQPNLGAARTGTIQVAGQNISITQSGCDFALTPSGVSLEAPGGRRSFEVRTTATCNWTATTTAPWITILDAPLRIGNGTLRFDVAPNNSGAVRTAVIAVGNESFTVTQDLCRFQIFPAARSFSEIGGTGSFDLFTSSTCTWTAVPGDTWVQIVGPATGTGNATITFAVDNSEGRQRQTTIAVGDQVFVVNQGVCTFAIAPAQATFYDAGGTGSFEVTTETFCAWTATANVDWITILSTGNGEGRQTVTYQVAPNTGILRTGYIQVGDKRFNVRQEPCTFAVSPTEIELFNSGGEGTFTITTSQSACPWTAVPSVDWIRIIGANTGTGTATVRFAVSSSSGALRTGFIDIAGQRVAIVQTACRVQLSPAGIAFGGDGGPGTIVLTIGDGCGWIAETNDDWITITSNPEGVGNGVVQYVVAPNAGITRQGRITINGVDFVITQSPCSFNLLTPTEVAFGHESAQGIIEFETAAGCSWTATSNRPWLRAFSLPEGVGSATVTFQVDRNTGIAREGRVTVGTISVRVVQEAAPGCSFTFANAADSFPIGGGTGTINVEVPTASCTWDLVAVDASGAPVPWISFSTARSGQGPATVNYTVANATGAAGQSREAIIRIDGLNSPELRVIQFTNPARVADFSFPVDAQGWTAASSGGFVAPAADFVDGQVRLTATASDNLFGWWGSPRVALGAPAAADSLFAAEVTVATNIASRDQVPWFRLRALQEDFSESSEFSVISSGDGSLAPVAGAPKSYTHYFQVPAGTSNLRLTVDMLNFDNVDSASGALLFDRIVVRRLPAALTGERVELQRDLAFADQRAGWGTGGGGTFARPLAEVDSRGLRLVADPEVDHSRAITFGFWFYGELGADPVVIDSNRLYRVTFLVSARNTRGLTLRKDRVPSFRLRLNESSFNASVLTNVESVTESARVPGASDKVTFDLYLAGRPEIAGQSLLAAFDYLFVDALNNDPAIALILESLTIRSYDMPN